MIKRAWFINEFLPYIKRELERELPEEGEEHDMTQRAVAILSRDLKHILSAMMEVKRK